VIEFTYFSIIQYCSRQNNFGTIFDITGKSYVLNLPVSLLAQGRQDTDKQ